MFKIGIYIFYFTIFRSWRNKTPKKFPEFVQESGQQLRNFMVSAPLLETSEYVIESTWIFSYYLFFSAFEIKTPALEKISVKGHFSIVLRYKTMSSKTKQLRSPLNRKVSEAHSFTDTSAFNLTLVDSCCKCRICNISCCPMFE